MNTSTRILLLIGIAAAVAAAIAWQKRDKYPDAGDAFEGGTPPPGDGMSMASNAAANT